MTNTRNTSIQGKLVSKASVSIFRFCGKSQILQILSICFLLIQSVSSFRSETLKVRKVRVWNTSYVLQNVWAVKRIYLKEIILGKSFLHFKLKFLCMIFWGMYWIYQDTLKYVLKEFFDNNYIFWENLSDHLHSPTLFFL